MNQRVKELFEQYTVPNFGVGTDPDVSKNLQGEYINPTLEDHWQTFQEAAELIVQECVGVIRGGSFLHDQSPEAQFARECSAALKRHFGVE